MALYRIARVANPVPVSIGLVRIGHQWAVVSDIRNAIVVVHGILDCVKIKSWQLKKSDTNQCSIFAVTAIIF